MKDGWKGTMIREPTCPSRWMARRRHQKKSRSQNTGHAADPPFFPFFILRKRVPTSTSVRNITPHLQTLFSSLSSWHMFSWHILSHIPLSLSLIFSLSFSFFRSLLPFPPKLFLSFSPFASSFICLQALSLSFCPFRLHQVMVVFFLLPILIAVPVLLAAVVLSVVFLFSPGSPPKNGPLMGTPRR